MTEKIEIMSADILEQHPELSESIRQTAAFLRIGLGWHYILDLTWAARELQAVPSQTVLDAGAGQGVMQWWLARKGIDVISVDRDSRARIHERFREWAPIRGMRPQDLQPASGSFTFGFARKLLSVVRHPRSLPASLREAKNRRSIHLTANYGSSGQVTIYNTDLADLSMIPDGSIDVVVSISALEHNAPENLPSVVEELLRVLKPNGRLIATLGAARDEDWYHRASRGWCYSEETLREVFGLKDVRSNYSDFDKLFERLRMSTALQKSLASFYYRSAKNGMPWGRWNPEYQSVGIVKIKGHEKTATPLKTA